MALNKNMQSGNTKNADVGKKDQEPIRYGQSSQKDIDVDDVDKGRADRDDDLDTDDDDDEA